MELFILLNLNGDFFWGGGIFYELKKKKKNFLR